MRTARQFCAALLLALALAFPVVAGELQTPGVTQPPPPTSTTGNIQLPDAFPSGQMDAPLTSDTGSVAEMTLVMMVNVLSMF